MQAYEQKASDELAQVRRFDDYPNWRLGRIRDVITAREAVIEVGDIFAVASGGIQKGGRAAAGQGGGDLGRTVSVSFFEARQASLFPTDYRSSESGDRRNCRSLLNLISRVWFLNTRVGHLNT